MNVVTAWAERLWRLCRSRPVASQVMRNFSFLLGGEGLGRIIRVLATIAMARALDVNDFGLLAVTLTCHELVAVLANNGFGLYLLKQDDALLQRSANTVWVLSWFWAGAMLGVQMLVAQGVGLLWQPEAGYLITAMAPLHLILPLALTHVYIIHRGGALGAFAGVTVAQNFADCLLTIVLLYLGFGLWSIVFAKCLSTMTWVLGIRMTKAWQLQPKQGFTRFQEPFQFTAPVLLSEYGKSIRLFGDNLLVGGSLGVEMLGIYYFAKNSGLGISLGLSQVSTTVATPRFAELTRSTMSEPEKVEKRVRLTRNLSLVVSLLIVLQAVLAPVYVPILFGEKWAAAVPILAILCLSALPRCIAEMHACLARNSHLAGLEATWNAGYTFAFLIAVSVAAQYGLYALAWATVALNCVCLLWIVDRTWQELGLNSYKAKIATEVS